jgi:hypothetical protein
MTLVWDVARQGRALVDRGTDRGDRLGKGYYFTVPDLEAQSDTVELKRLFHR